MGDPMSGGGGWHRTVDAEEVRGQGSRVQSVC